MFCTHCGKKNPDNAKFCAFCGEKQLPSYQGDGIPAADTAWAQEGQDAPDAGSDMSPAMAMAEQVLAEQGSAAQVLDEDALGGSARDGDLPVGEPDDDEAFEDAIDNDAFNEPQVGRHAATEPQAAAILQGTQAQPQRRAGTPSANPRISEGGAPSPTAQPTNRPAQEQRVYRQPSSGRTAAPGDSPVPADHAAYVRPDAPAQLPPSRYTRPANSQGDGALDVPRGGAQRRTAAPAGPAGRPGQRAGSEPPKRPPQNILSSVQQLPYDDEYDDEYEDDEGSFFSPLVIAALMVLVAVLAAAGWLFLTGSGQMWRASVGMNAPASAYWSLGDSYAAQSQTERAVDAYEKALRLDVNSFEGSLKLAKALELNDNAERAMRAYNKCISLNNKNPEPYRRLAQILTREGRDAESAQVLQDGIAKTGDSSLSGQVSSLAPPAPKASPEGGYYAEQVSVVLTSSAGSRIYYTLDGSKPDESSKVFQNYITLGDGEHTLRTVAYLAGIVGQEAAYTYKVELPPPAAPVLNPPEGTYTARNGESITLAISADMDAIILYTTDGTTPGADSPRYTEPITLPTGRHTVIVGAMSPSGKASELVRAEYNIKE